MNYHLSSDDPESLPSATPNLLRIQTLWVYLLYFVEDCCSNQEPEVPNFLSRRIPPRQAEAVKLEDVIKTLA